MSKKKTPSFVHELDIKASPEEINILNKRLEVARQIYNACLGEALKRLKLMRDSTLYQQALAMQKKTKERQAHFQEAEKFSQFREYDLHTYVKILCKDTWLSEHIDSATAQKLASRAFKAVKGYAVGKRGRPRFRSKHRFSSVESKSNQAGICFREGKIRWKGLVLDVNYDFKDKHGLESHALSCRTKYVRLVRRFIKGKVRWIAQLVQEGLLYLKSKNAIGSGIVGLDIGPSTIAVVGKSEARLQAFCPEVKDYSAKIKALQKKMNRSHQAAEWQRKMTETRKRSHGELVNNILRLGKTVKTEKLSYSAFQKQFGKSVQNRAPGMFLEKLRTKAANAGGEVIEFATRTTALSQTCQCGRREKKALKERWHLCPLCGIQAQRDLYSAYLACFVTDNRLDTHQACKAWAGGGMLLEQAVSNLNKTAMGKVCFASFGLGQSWSGSSVKKESIQHKALDVVA